MNSDSNSEVLKIDLECTKCQSIKRDDEKIPVRRIIEKLDGCFKTNDLTAAQALLEHWQGEAKALGDISGELSVVNEMLGLYRKTANKQSALVAIERAMELIGLNGVEKEISGATIMLNAATTYKAFGNAEKAIPLYENVEKIYTKGLEGDDLLFAAFYNNFATALVDLEIYEKAEELYKKAIEITGNSVNSLLDCAVSYMNIAHLYEKRDGAESPDIDVCLKKAEEILNDQRIEKNAYYAFVCEKCAPSFDYFGYFLLANELKRKSREIYEGT